MKTPLTLEDFLKYTFFSEPVLSPDGKTAAVVQTTISAEKNEYLSDIMLLDLDSGSIRQVTSTGNARQLTYLEDGSLLFASLRDPELKKRVEAGEVWTEFFTVREGADEKELMRIPAKVSKVLSLADGRYLLKAEYNNNYPSIHLFEGESKEAALKQMAEDTGVCLVAEELPFRQDGHGFHNGLRNRLAVFDPKDRSLSWITPARSDVEQVAVQDDTIAYTAHMWTSEKPMRYPCGIYTYDLRNGQTRQIVEETTYRIRFLCFVEGDLVFSGSDLKRYGNQENPWFYRIHDGEIQLLAQNEESAMNSVGSDCRYGGGQTYQECDGSIYFLSTMGGSAVLKEVRPDGSIAELTQRNGTVDSFCVRGNRVVFVGMKENRLQEVYLLQNGKELTLTHANDWVQEDLSIVSPVPMSFSSCGHVLEGYVMAPVGFDATKRYPAILDIHGGHKCAYGPIFYHEMQLWANLGYFVFFCNPRGSDGGGNELAEIIGRYGEIDYADIMKFTDEVLLRYPQIDPDRIGVTGGSYGGFMTNWIIGHTHRFRCAVSQRSIASYISMFCTSDTGYSFPMNGFRTSLWDDPGRYWSHSPLKYADKVTTPTLFIHSENDYRCPVSEGIQMFSALKYNGVEARLCIFKNECHELSRSGKPISRVRRLREITNWFESHLKKQEVEK